MDIENIDLKEYIARLEYQLQFLIRQKETIEADLEQAKATLDKMMSFQNKGFSEVTENVALKQKFEGKSIRKCLQIIARENNGLLNVGEARDILYAAGRMTKNLSADIVRNREFIKGERRGIYYLDESLIPDEVTGEDNWSFLRRLQSSEDQCKYYKAEADDF